MSAQPIPATPLPAETLSVAGQWAQDAQHYLEILRELADTGTAIVRIVHQRVRMQADEPTVLSILSDNYPLFSPPPLADARSKFVQEAAESLDVLSRSIRRSIMLAQKIAQETIQQSATVPSTAQHPNAARDRIRRDIEDAIHRANAKSDNERQDHQGIEAERFPAERPERQDSPDPQEDIAARPIADLIASICRQLGLAALPESNPQQHSTLQDIEPPRAPTASPPPPNSVTTLAAAQASATPVPRDGAAPPSAALTPPNTHQPGPSIPPTPFPRL